MYSPNMHSTYQYMHYAYAFVMYAVYKSCQEQLIISLHIASKYHVSYT